MLHEDQQVGRPILKLVYTVEVCALVIRHISQIILEILIFCPDDAHGWVRALSSKHTLLWRKREREGEEENKTISQH